MNPAESVQRHGEQTPDARVMMCDGEEQTYAQLQDRSQRLAHGLRGIGLEPGDCIALLVGNGPTTLEQLVAVSAAGMIRAPLYGHDPAPRHEYLLRLTGARALIIDEEYYAPLAPLLADCPALDHIIVIGEGDVALAAIEAGSIHAYESLVGDVPDKPIMVDMAPDAPYQIRFSAGTTGFPKGILHDVQGWMAAGDQIAEVLDRPLDTSTCYLAAGPLTHAATMPVWPVLAAGGSIVVMASFDAGHFLELIERHGVTLTLVVPAMVQVLASHPDAATRDLSSLAAVYYGTSPMPEATLRAGLDLWGNVMYQVYGQSEALPVTALTPRDHVPDGTPEERARLRSAGRLLESCGLRILAEDDTEVPLGEVGEIVVKSPGRMREIWGDPEATAARITQEGWVRTRDMGRVDEHGFLFLADRKEDMIISGGYNIWPAELENALTNHPSVAEAAVVGVPHPRWGETPHAVVVLDPEAESATEDALIAWTRKELGSVKKVTAVTFTDVLPRSPVGKILRRVLRSDLETPAEGAVVQ